ncbi:MAG TPA: sporulation protein YqfD [Tissierellaceae bacterium]|nr:sporulation protein YqfD [Tissierellaceae bacterium]
MLAIKIWNYLKGYVIIRIKGLSLERLLNLALANNIYLRDVNRISNVEIEATVSLKGYKALEKIVSKTGCRVDIEDNGGIPFLLERIKKRKMLGFGVIIFIVLVGLLSSVVWEIEVLGTEQIAPKEIHNILKDNGIKVGKWKKDLDTEEIEKALLKELEYISFLEVRTSGVKLIVDLKEQDIPPEKIDKSYPSNLVAKKKGVITKIMATNGSAVVKKGKVVEKGDILITGVMESEDSEESYLVHSEGEVLAETRYTHTIEEPIVKEKKQETGRIYRQRGLKFGGKGIKFFSGDIPYDDYIEEVEEKDIINLKWPKIDIPIKIVNHIFVEVKSEEVKHDVEYLKQKAQIEAVEEINKTLSKDTEIISKDIIHTIEDNILKTKVIVETLEDISKVQIISE